MASYMEFLRRLVTVEALKRKMVGLSKGMLHRMEEEYRSMLQTTANNSATSSASNSKRIEFPDSSSFSIRRNYEEPTLNEEGKCSGNCKSMVRRIVEQVRAETEQWLQMQEMLGSTGTILHSVVPVSLECMGFSPALFVLLILTIQMDPLHILCSFLNFTKNTTLSSGVISGIWYFYIFPTI